MFQNLLQEVRALLDDDEQESGVRSGRWRPWVRFWVQVGQSFVRNRCPVRASALAYSSLLAFIPLLAVAIGILTSVLKNDQAGIRVWIDGLLQNVVPQLMRSEEFAGTKDVVVTKILDWIGNVHSGALGTGGTVALLVVILFMMARIEETLNDIWGVTRGRSWYARVVNYWAAISLGPIVILSAIGFSTILRLEEIKAWLQHAPFLAGLTRFAPIPILAGACALFYALMPNTKVQWKSALVGGGVAGVLWFLNNELGAAFVSEAAKRNSAIYGSIAVLPVFMVGLYFFWVLLLFGAQVAYTYQNRRSYLMSRQTDRVHQDGREFVALRIMIEAARAYVGGGGSPSVSVLADRLEVPGQLISHTTSILLRARLLVEVSDGEAGFLPARPLESITVSDVLEAMRRGVGSRLPTRSDAGRVLAEAELARVVEAERSAGGRNLAELARAMKGGTA